MGASEASDEIAGEVGGEEVSGHDGVTVVIGSDGESGVGEAVVFGENVLDVCEAIEVVESEVVDHGLFSVSKNPSSRGQVTKFSKPCQTNISLSL